MDAALEDPVGKGYDMGRLTMETLDDLGLFWIDEQLILVAGSPMSGKTAYAVQSCFVANIEGNGPAVYFSLIANSWNIRKVLFLQQAKRTGGIHNIGDLQKMPAIPVYLEDYERPPIEKLIERIFYFKKEKGAQFFVIDYLQLIDCSTLGLMNLDRESALNRVLELLKSIARALGVIVMIVSEISSHWEKRGYPTIRDILDVSEAETYCDQILFVHHSTVNGMEAGSDNTKRSILIAKGYFDTDDDDEMASIDMHLDLETMTFIRIAYDTESMD